MVWKFMWHSEKCQYCSRAKITVKKEHSSIRYEIEPNEKLVLKTKQKTIGEEREEEEVEYFHSFSRFIRSDKK